MTRTIEELKAEIERNLAEQRRLTVFVPRGQVVFQFGADAPPESSAGAEATPTPPPVAEEAATLCTWCGISPATTIVYGWETCVVCAGSRDARVRAYQQRLKSAARG